MAVYIKRMATHPNEDECLSLITTSVHVELGVISHQEEPV